MERFVRLLLAGGIATVAGLWAVTLFEGGSPPWAVGVGLVVVGVAGLAGGIRRELDY